MLAKEGMMKIVITSDTHFGDGTSQLAALDSGGNPGLGPKYPEFREACGKDNDYLVMLGDVIDVAIKDYKDAYNIAKVFYKQVAKDGIAKRILYVPGNHDYDLWHAVEYQTNIIKRITEKRKKDISLFKMSVPAVLDDREGRAGSEIFLANVTRRPDAQKPYGGLFLDYLADNELEFYVAFPNVYLMTARKGCILMTHGQYFQQFWSLLSDYAPPIFGEKLEIGKPPLSIKNLAHLNFPLSQLSSSGVGQAGPLSDVIRDIQYEFKAHRSETIAGYIDNLEKVLRKETLKWYNPYHWGIKLGIYLAKKEIKKWIAKRPESSPRKDEDWEYKPDTHRKMADYYKSCTLEIEGLNKASNLNIPANPNVIIFGHSHRPIGINETGRLAIRPFEDQSLKVPMFNTGGWLEDEEAGQKRFNGIELFTYETDKGINSIKIGG
jgi:predicted phosphodiesterase